MIKEDLKIPYPMERTIYLTSYIEENNIADTIKKILEIRNSDRVIANLYTQLGGGKYAPDPIELIINSYGGQIYPAISLLSLMEAHEETPVNTYCFGYAMSAAFLIFINGRQRHGTRNTTLMYHQLSTLMYGKLNDIIIDTKECIRLQKLMNAIVCNNSKITTSLLEKYLSKGNWFITPSQSQKLGLIDLFLASDDIIRFKSQTKQL